MKHVLLSSGSNAQGQLGIGSVDDSHVFQKCSFEGYIPQHLPTQTKQIVDIATGANHTILLLEVSDPLGGHGKEIWGCGDGSKGQLGSRYKQQTQKQSTALHFRKIVLELSKSGLENYTPKLIAATWETSYIVLSREGADDLVISMGSDDYGDLGIGGANSAKEYKDFHVVAFGHVFDQDIGHNHIEVDAITSGQRHVVVHLRVTSNNKSSSQQIIVGWGASRHGQLGTTGSSKPPPIASIPRVIQTSRLDDPILVASLGIHHSVFLHASGHISALGSDRKGQMQAISHIDKAEDVRCTWNGTYCVVHDDSTCSIISSGSNSHGQLGFGSPGELSSGRVEFPCAINTADMSIRIACGSEHVLALLTSHSTQDSATDGAQVWGWGWNEHGNLGLGHVEDVAAPACIWPLGVENIPANVSGIWAGCGTSWISCQYHEN